MGASRPDEWQYRRNGLIAEDRELPPGVTRIAAAVEYDGSGFCGWQRQSHCVGVQQVVETALSRVAAESVVVVCAGRTDSGVHATHQVIHFDTCAERSSRSWILGANSHLPDSVRLHWAQPVAAQFHARFSAISRTYRYLISNQAHRPALHHGGLTWAKYPLNVELMKSAIDPLLGEQDFSAFRGAGCQSLSAFRNVQRVEIGRRGHLVVVEITANAFLLHMVRNIVGALMVVGRGERPPQWIAELLAGRDRTRSAATAPPNGLYLVAVDYPSRFAIAKPAPHYGVLAELFG